LLDEVLFHPKRLRIAIILYLTGPKPLNAEERPRLKLGRPLHPAEAAGGEAISA